MIGMGGDGRGGLNWIGLGQNIIGDQNAGLGRRDTESREYGERCETDGPMN